MDLRPTTWKVHKISGPNLVHGFPGPFGFHSPRKKIMSYLFSILLSGPPGGGSNCNLIEWKWSRRKRSCANIWSKFSVQLPWTTSCPPVKGGYHVWSDTGWIRHGVVVCRIVNWKGLNAYSVTSPLNIWTKFGVWLPRTLGGPPSKGKHWVVSIIYFIEWTAKGGGRGSNCNMKFE